MDGKKINVTSQVPGHVGVYLPNLNFRREFSVQGQVIGFPAEIMEEAMFDEGFRNMIDQGILAIKDLDDLKSLGLEEQDATEPENYRTYTTADYARLIQKASFEEFEEEVEKMRDEQIRCLIDFSTELKMRDEQKCNLLKEKFNVDIDARIYEQKRRAED